MMQIMVYCEPPGGCQYVVATHPGKIFPAVEAGCLTELVEHHPDRGPHTSSPGPPFTAELWPAGYAEDILLAVIILYYLPTRDPRVPLFTTSGLSGPG